MNRRHLIAGILGFAAVPAAILASPRRYSAAQGFDTPAGLALSTQLHPTEMILPRTIADPLGEAIALRPGTYRHIRVENGSLTADQVERALKRGWKLGRVTGKVSIPL